VRRSTFAGNGRNGVVVVQGAASLENSTLSGNATVDLAANAGTVSCTHCTVVLDGASAAIRASDGAVVSLANSLVVGHCDLFDGGTVDSAGGNFESPGATCNLGSNDRDEVVDNGIEELGDHGGPTRTHRFFFNAPPADEGDSGLCLATDQRGGARPINGDAFPAADCDPGAFEFGFVRPPTPIFHDGVDQGHPGAWSDTTP
jgi:hypothetical protein